MKKIEKIERYIDDLDVKSVKKIHRSKLLFGFVVIIGFAIASATLGTIFNMYSVNIEGDISLESNFDYSISMDGTDIIQAVTTLPPDITTLIGGQTEIVSHSFTNNDNTNTWHVLIADDSDYSGFDYTGFEMTLPTDLIHLAPLTTEFYDFIYSLDENFLETITLPSLVTVTCNQNEPPIADAGVDIITSEGVPITLDGSGSTDDTGIISWCWDLDRCPQFNGCGETFEVTISLIDLSGATHTDVILIATDDDGATDTDTMTIYIC